MTRIYMSVVLAALAAFAALPASAATADNCYRPASGPVYSDKGATHGNWLPTHNTANYDRVNAGGNDYYKKVRKCNVVVPCGHTVKAERCPNGGSIKVNFSGLIDHCVVNQGATPAQNTAPFCTDYPCTIYRAQAGRDACDKVSSGGGGGGGGGPNCYSAKPVCPGGFIYQIK